MPEDDFGIGEFLAPEPEYGVPIILLDGDPKTGRTAAFLSFPLREVVFSYDAKVGVTLDERYPNGRPWPITIADVSKTYHVAESEWGASAAEAHSKIVQSLQRIRARGGVDCVVHDGLHILAQLEEQRMRHIKGIKPFATFSDRGYWKIRTLALREIVTESLRAARFVVFTTTAERGEAVNVVKDGVVTETRQQPKWYDPVDSLVDVWLRTSQYADPKSGTGKFFVTVMSSKFRAIPTHKTWDVTDSDLGSKIGYEAFHTGFRTRVQGEKSVKDFVEPIHGGAAQKKITDDLLAELTADDAPAG